MEGMYILVVPADNADAQNPGAASVRNAVNDAANSGEPVHFQNPAGGSSTAYWGVFHVEAAAEATPTTLLMRQPVRGKKRSPPAPLARPHVLCVRTG